MNLKELSKPIDNFKWKINRITKDKTKAECVPYIDARDVAKRLDEVCGIQNWQNKYYQVKDTMFCAIGIKIGDEWVWKSSAGSEIVSKLHDETARNAVETKGEDSDAFKRAGVKWGIGVNLYSGKPVYVGVINNKPVDERGKIIWDLTAHIKKIQDPNYKEPERPTTTNVKATANTRKADLKLTKEGTIEQIEKAFKAKKISEETKAEWIDEVNSAVNMAGTELIVWKLDIIDSFWELKPYIDKGNQKYWIEQINELTMQNAKMTFEEINRTLAEHKKRGR